jgi:imidazolonepropionase-like amidohydrolase
MENRDRRPLVGPGARARLAVAAAAVLAAAAGMTALPQEAPVRIYAARLIDGTGRIMEPATIEVQGSTIVRIEQRRGPAITIDLGDATLMPGMIDVHVHLNWYFGPNGKYGEQAPPEFRDKAIAENAKATLLAGFTTVQSLGWQGDKALRARIDSGEIVGPRLLSSLGQIQPGQARPAGVGRNGQPVAAREAESTDALRKRVQDLKAAGADAIKIFASGSIRDGGKMNVTQEQLDALCGEAKKAGLRTLVHAHDPASIIASVKAGCTQIEHGAYADDAAIKAMKDADVYFDPNIGLVLQNYVENKDHYMGTGNFDADGFAFMEKAVSTLPPIFHKALVAGLKMPMGTDAVAGAHGQNAREIVVRVRDGGQKPMDAIVGATSLAARSLGLEKSIGTLASGFDADIVAVNGNPLTDITKVRDVKFVMKAGKIYKQ